MDLQDPTLLNWLTAMGSAELCILDAELATVRDTPRVVCPFLWSRKSGFTVDEMEEFIELSDLIVRKDPALANWLNTGITGMQIPAPTNRSWRLDLGTTESTKSALREMFLKETPSCQLITPDAAFTATQTSGELIKTYGYLQLFRRAMNDAMHSFTSEQRTAGAYSYCRGLLESSVDDSRKDVAVLDCIVRLPHDLSYEEFSNLRVSCFGRPAFVFGRWIGRKQMNASGIDPDLIPGDRLLMVYAVLVLPDAFRTKQVFMHSHLEEIVWKSKLHINASLPMSQWKEAICSKYNEAWLSLQQCSDPVSLRNWINQLGVALGVQEPSSSSVFDILDGWNDPTVGLPTFLAITCNLLFRFYWQFSPQWLHHCRINLLLMRETNLELYSDEGNRIFLTIQHGSDEAVLYPSQTKGADLTELSRASIRLLAPFNQTTPRDGDDVVSKFTLMTARPDTIHNPLSNLLLVSIGTLDSTLRRALEDSVAAIVELEDRHVRVSNLPEPWQYNLPKAMMAVVSNPNIRHIVAVGAVQNARVSLRYLEIMAKTPSDFESLPSDLESLPSIYIPPDLTARVAKQLIAIEQYSGDPKNTSRMMTFARTHTINSYLDDKLTGICESIEGSQIVLSMPLRTPMRSPPRACSALCKPIPSGVQRISCAYVGETVVTLSANMMPAFMALKTPSCSYQDP